MSLPAATPEERAAIFPFLQQSIIMPMPQSDLADWLVGLTLYYKPDSREDLKLVAFEKSDNELFTQEEADAQWVEYNGWSVCCRYEIYANFRFINRKERSRRGLSRRMNSEYVVVVERSRC